jgi:hypothetical protein
LSLGAEAALDRLATGCIEYEPVTVSREAAVHVFLFVLRRTRCWRAIALQVEADSCAALFLGLGLYFDGVENGVVTELEVRQLPHQEGFGLL